VISVIRVVKEENQEKEISQVKEKKG